MISQKSWELMLFNSSVIAAQFFVITALDVAKGLCIHTIPCELPETSFSVCVIY